MSNNFYNAGGAPSQGSQLVSANVRAEFTAIAAGFDKLPTLTSNPYKLVYVNSSASGLDVIGGNGLVKLSTSGVPTIAVAGTDYQAWSANLDEYAAVNPTAAGLALLDDADAAAQRTTLGLGTAAVAASGDFATAGHNHAGVYQPASANLDEYAAVNPTAAGLALLDDADAAAQRTTLGLGALATTTPGANVATALAVAVGTDGAFVVKGGALGTPSSGVATNLTGTAANLTAGISNALKSATTTVDVSAAAAPSSGQVLTATGATTATWQTPATVTSSAPRSYLAGYGLSNNGTDAVNDIDIAAGTCRDATNTYDITLAAALTKRLDAAWAVGTNQGGLDTGAIANGTYHVWAIRRSDTGVVDVLFSTSATAPTMPANYDAKRRIGSILREAGSIVAFKQYGDRFRRSVPVTDVNATSTGTSAVTRTLASVPTGITVLADISAYLDNGTTAGRLACLITALDEADTVPTTTLFTLLAGNNAAARISQSSCMYVKTNTSAQIRTRCDSSGGSDLLVIVTMGWIDRRGQDD